MVETLKGNILKAVYIAGKDEDLLLQRTKHHVRAPLSSNHLLGFLSWKDCRGFLDYTWACGYVSLFGAGAIESIALPLERAKGTFDRLLVAPISLTTIVIGKALGGFFFGIFLSIGYILIALLLPGAAIANPFLFASGIVLSALTFSALGVCISTPFRDVPQAMPPATLIRVAMIFLGGVFIPINSMPSIVQFIAALLPVTYAVDMLRQATMGNIILQSIVVDVAALTLFALVFFAVAVWILKRTLQ